MGNLSGYGIYKLGGSGGGGAANTIYNADDTIGSGRIATLTDTLTFAGTNAKQVHFGVGTYIKTTEAGYTSYAIYVGHGTVACGINGAFQVLSYNSELRANHLKLYGSNYLTSTNAGLWTISNTTSASYNIGARFGIVTLGSTSATTGFLVQNSSATDILKADDDGTITINGRVNQGGLGLSTYFGQDAGETDDLTNNANTGFGYFCLKGITTGVQNTCVGYGTANTMGAGRNNVLIGNQTMANRTGEENTIVGGNLNMGGNVNYNTIVGYQCGWVVSGNSNTLMGRKTMFLGSSAANNVAIGSFAGYDNSTGDSNTYLGYNSGRGLATGSSNTIIGANITGLSSSLFGHVVLGSGDGTVRLFIDNNGAGVMGSSTIAASAILKLDSTTQGFLPPSMTTVQKNAITPATGLTLYDTDTNEFNYYNGSAWVGLGSDSDGIYSGSGSLSGATVVTTGANDLTFTATTGDILFNNNVAPNPILFIDGATNTIGMGGNATVTEQLSIYNQAGSGNTTGLGIYGNNTTGSQIAAFINASGRATTNTALHITSTGATTNYGLLVEDGNVGIGTLTPVASALLEMTSTTQGFLPTRMTTAQMNAIGTPATGLILYDTDTNQCMLYNGTSWVIMG